MHATEIMAEMEARGIELYAEGDALRFRAPRGALTAELRATLAAHKAELLARLRSPTPPKTAKHMSGDLRADLAILGADTAADDLAAVLLRGTVIGDVWLVADEGALAEHPEILRAGLPVIFFDEVERLRGMPLEGLRTVLGIKCTFPTSRVIQ